MKNLFLSLAFMLIGSFAFANNTKEIKDVKEIKKETIKQLAAQKVVLLGNVDVYCNGEKVGTISCGSCSTAQLVNAAVALCK